MAVCGSMPLVAPTRLPLTQGNALGIARVHARNGSRVRPARIRSEQKNMAVIEKANAVGTTLLRVRLLPLEYQDQARSQIGEYIKLCVAGLLADNGREE